LAYKIHGPAVHGPIAGGKDDKICFEFCAISQNDAVFDVFAYLTMYQLHSTINDQLAGADVDVITRSTAQLLHEQIGVIVTEVKLKSGILKAFVKTCIALAHLVVKWDLKFVHDPVW